MKEILYTFQTRGGYLPDTPAVFGEETQLRLTVAPHEFELKLSGQVLRSSSFRGCGIEVSSAGAVCFRDSENVLLARLPETGRKFAEVRLIWSQDRLSLEFGQEETVDNYPNCDGEYDRWSEKWVAEYTVNLNLANHSLETR